MGAGPQLRRYAREMGVRESDRPRIRALMLSPFPVIAVAALVLIASATAGSVKPKPGRFQGNSGAFSVGFKVSSSSKQITGLRTDFQATVSCGPPSSIPVHV